MQYAQKHVEYAHSQLLVHQQLWGRVHTTRFCWFTHRANRYVHNLVLHNCKTNAEQDSVCKQDIKSNMSCSLQWAKCIPVLFGSLKGFCCCLDNAILATHEPERWRSLQMQSGKEFYLRTSWRDINMKWEKSCTHMKIHRSDYGLKKVLGRSVALWVPPQHLVNYSALSLGTA